MMTAALSSTVGTPEASRIRPTSARDRRCGRELGSCSGDHAAEVDHPPEPADRAAAREILAASRSIVPKSPVPIEWIR